MADSRKKKRVDKAPLPHRPVSSLASGGTDGVGGFAQGRTPARPAEMPVVAQVEQLQKQRRESAVPPADPSTDLGPRVKALRTRKGLTLKQVSVLSGVSVSSLSKIERDELSPTLTTLQRIAMGLEVELAALIDSVGPARSPTGRRSVARAGQGENLNTATCANRLLCSDLRNKKFTPILTRVTARSPDEYASWGVSQGEIFLMVLRGRVVIHSRLYEPLTLDAGDAIYYDASTEYCWTSASDEDAEVLWILGN